MATFKKNNSSTISQFEKLHLMRSNIRKMKQTDSSMQFLIEELFSMRPYMNKIYQIQQNGNIGYNSFITKNIDKNMRLVLKIAKHHNNSFKRVEKRMKETSFLFCSICKMEMVSEFLLMNPMCETCICKKCACNIESYRARICDNCDYPKIDYPKIKCQNFNVKKQICNICQKYQYGMVKEKHANFFKMVFFQINDVISDSDSDNDSDNDNDNDNDYDYHCWWNCCYY